MITAMNLNQNAATALLRRHAGLALLALLIPVVMLPVSVLVPIIVLAALAVGAVELARWARADRFSLREPRLDDPRDLLDARLVGFRR